MNKTAGPVVVAGLSDTQADTLFDLFDKIILFRCDEEVFFGRINNRINHDFGKHESEQKMIRGWYKEFEQEMLDKGAIPIDTDQPIEQIVNIILQEFEAPNITR